MGIDTFVGIVGGALGVASFIVQVLDKRPRIGVFITPIRITKGPARRNALVMVVANAGVAPFTVCGAGVCYNGRKIGRSFRRLDQFAFSHLDAPQIVQQGAFAMYEVPAGAFDAQADGPVPPGCEQTWELYVNLPTGEKWQGEHKGSFAAYCRAALEDAAVELDEGLSGLVPDP